MKTFTFITTLKEPLELFFKNSLMGRAQKNHLININVHSLLEDVDFDHHKLDDSPYGGGPGELLRIDVLVRALENIAPKSNSKRRILLMDPAGKVFDQSHATRLSLYDELVFLSGRYEGFDARIFNFVDESLSLGDFVLTNGDMAALAMADAIARLIPGFLGNQESIIEESHQHGRLESSLYTRPEDFRGLLVPEIFKSGHHKNIAHERKVESIKKTMTIRPDLINKYPLSLEEKKLLNKDEKNYYPWQKLYE